MLIEKPKKVLHWLICVSNVLGKMSADQIQYSEKYYDDQYEYR